MQVDDLRSVVDPESWQSSMFFDPRMPEVGFVINKQFTIFQQGLCQSSSAATGNRIGPNLKLEDTLSTG